MGRIKDIGNAFSINIHATKEFVDGDNTIIIGKLTNWYGDNSGISWVGITMDRNRDVLNNYNFGFSEEDAIASYGTLYGNDKFNDTDRSIKISYHHKVEKPTGWNWHNGVGNFQECVLYSYMSYEAIYADDIDITINGNSFNISGNVFDMDNDELLFRFKAAPGICDYSIEYYNRSGDKIDASEFARIEEKICGVSCRDVDNAIYFVIANKIYTAMINTPSIAVLIKTCYYINDAYKKNLTTLTTTDYIKELFADGAIDRFVAEFMMSLIDKHGNINV